MIRRAAPAALLTACGSQPHWPDTPPGACTPSDFPRGEIVVDVRHQGKARRAIAWVPDTPGPWDVAVVLHEFRADPRRQLAYSRWVPEGPRAGVLTVAPDGRSSTWNAGTCCGRSFEHRTADVGFLDALIATLDASGCTTGRVLATGIGNGGMMAEWWAWNSDVPDAVVSVGGALQHAPPHTGRPVPVLHYHGTADRFIPLDGRPGVMPGGERGGGTTPTGEAHAAWTARNGGGEPEVRAAGPLACLARLGRAPTVLCLIDGAADTWPGAQRAEVDVDHPLADATTGGLGWARRQWDRSAAGDGVW